MTECCRVTKQLELIGVSSRGASIFVILHACNVSWIHSYRRSKVIISNGKRFLILILILIFIIINQSPLKKKYWSFILQVFFVFFSLSLSLPSKSIEKWKKKKYLTEAKRELDYFYLPYFTLLTLELAAWRTPDSSLALPNSVEPFSFPSTKKKKKLPYTLHLTPYELLHSHFHSHSHSHTLSLPLSPQSPHLLLQHLLHHHHQRLSFVREAI